MPTVRSLSQLAALVRSRRTELGLTQAALAELAGVSRWWVTEFESGRARAELGLALRLLDALDLVIDVSPREAARDRLAPAADDRVDLDDLLDQYGER